MKKSILAFTVLCACMLTVFGCGGKRQLKEMRALVASVVIDNDTVKTMKAVADGDTLLFKLADARFTNGIVVHGDSVYITYIEGRKDTLRALVVGIIPQAPRYFDPKAAKNDTLVTAPAKTDEPQGTAEE